MAAFDTVPTYVGAMTDEAFWQRMQMRFDGLASLFDMRLETVTEAVGRQEPSDHKSERVWVDDAPRWDGQRAWLLLPHIDALDQARLREQMEIGRDLVQSIHERLAKRELSPSFLYDWGRLRRCRPDRVYLFLKHLCRSQAFGTGRWQSQDRRRRGSPALVRPLLLRHYKRGRRGEAEKTVEQLVNAIVDGQIAAPMEWDVKWFESYVMLEDPNAPDYARLRPAFNEHSLSVQRMRELAAMGTDGIPPVDLEIPDP
ncbi:hypothetical protein ACVOMV_06065 [Mesorhizobium atlanticum]